MLARLPDWRSRLSALVEGALQRPFEWGWHDCALFAADAVLAMTGADPAEGWRGTYTSAYSAWRRVKAAGFAGHVQIVEGLLKPVAPMLAATGDIGVISGPDEGPALGVFLGAEVAAPGEAGLVFTPRVGIVTAFHVPFAGEDA